jgi:catechol 2,3-dioxygenase-like lactoylglutathione lyase family enzyme
MRIAIACLVIGILGCSDSKPARDKYALAEAAKKCLAHDGMSCTIPILTIKELRASQAYYRDKLGFKVDWDHGDPPDFGAVSRDHSVIFMCQQCQGTPGAWLMIFTKDVDALHAEYVKRGAIIKMAPTDMPWGLREMQVQDPDGNVIRFGGHGNHDD